MLFVSAMPMYGPREGNMIRCEAPDMQMALVLAGGMIQSGTYLFVTLEDEDGNEVLSERSLKEKIRNPN